LARKIVAASDAGGGYLKLPDLAGQHSEWIDPISATYRGHRVVEMPPNGQGLVVLMALRILEGYDIAGLFQSDIAEAEHLILEGLKLSFALKLSSSIRSLEPSAAVPILGWMVWLLAIRS
jgi:gamma-glutamyltranspeptidase/glutathione hydrolase